MMIFPILFDDGVMLQGVKYTDIDYLVFTDAAKHVSLVESPFDRHTYRYSPFIAQLLSFADNSSGFYWWRNSKYFGKILFCMADALCGLFILKLRRNVRCKSNQSHNDQRISIELQDALWWLYNPFSINICTRGSAESFVVLFPVLLTVAIACSDAATKLQLRWKAVLSGAIHGLSIHSKLYPVIYTASFMAYFSKKENDIIIKDSPKTTSPAKFSWEPQMPAKPKYKGYEMYSFPWFDLPRLFHLTKLWILRLLAPSSILFAIGSISSFAILTMASVYLYGRIALDEGFLYHFSRLDHRHNYSIFWYWIYLARGRYTSTNSTALSLFSLASMGKVLMIPQMILLLYSSLGIAPYDLEFTLFLQTFLFVAMNKVITAQYFTWYLVLLPLCSERIRWNVQSQYRALALFAISTVSWLLSAFFLEMKGLPIHIYVWMASIAFFVGNVNLFCTICSNYQSIESSAYFGNKKRD
jgi:phosphatidylinositol glycan class M